MPEAINNLKVHRFLAAPKIGKYLGFGVNAKYKFWIIVILYYYTHSNLTESAYSEKSKKPSIATFPIPLTPQLSPQLFSIIQC